MRRGQALLWSAAWLLACSTALCAASWIDALAATLDAPAGRAEWGLLHAAVHAHSANVLDVEFDPQLSPRAQSDTLERLLGVFHRGVLQHDGSLPVTINIINSHGRVLNSITRQLAAPSSTPMAGD